MKLISSLLRTTAESIGTYWTDRIKKDYGIFLKNAESDDPVDLQIARKVYEILTILPVKLIKFCKIPTYNISYNMGLSKRFSPNHGFFRESMSDITLNADIFIHPDLPEDFIRQDGFFVDRPTQTLVHEIFHAIDARLGNVSEKQPWLGLSGWSETYKPGLKRLFVQEEGAPDLIGEWYYDPKIIALPGHGFTRFYASRNPGDDFADSGSMRFCLPDKLPRVKKEYFDDLLKDII